MPEWTDQYIEAWNTHDAVATASFMTENAAYIHWWGGRWKTFRGRAVILAWISELVEEWSSDYRLEKIFAITTETGFLLEYQLQMRVGSTPAPESA